MPPLTVGRTLRGGGQQIALGEPRRKHREKDRREPPKTGMNPLKLLNLPKPEKRRGEVHRIAVLPLPLRTSVAEWMPARRGTSSLLSSFDGADPVLTPNRKGRRWLHRQPHPGRSSGGPVKPAIRAERRPSCRSGRNIQTCAPEGKFPSHGSRARWECASFFGSQAMNGIADGNFGNLWAKNSRPPCLRRKDKLGMPGAGREARPGVDYIFWDIQHVGPQDHPWSWCPPQYARTGAGWSLGACNS